MTPDSDRLAESLAHLLGQADLEAGALEPRLAEVVERAQELFGVDGVGLMLATSSGELRLASATNPPAAALERAQEALGDGPGVESTRRRAVVSVADLLGDSRWPRLAEALSEEGVRAILSAPIWLHGRPAGNLNLLCCSPREWSRADGQALAAFAGIVTAFLRIAVDGRHAGEIADRLRVHVQAATPIQRRT